MRPQMPVTVLVSAGVLVLACGPKPPRTNAATQPSVRPAKAAPAKTLERAGRRLVLDGAPPLPLAPTRRFRRYLQVRHTSFVAWEHQRGGMLVRARVEQREQIFRVPGPGSARRQLTFDASAKSAAAIPGSYDGSVLVLSDDGAASTGYLDRIALLEGGIQRMGEPPGLSTAYCFFQDGRLAYNSNARNGRDFDIYVAEPSSKAGRRVYNARGTFVPLDCAPNGKELLLLEVLSRRAGRLHLLELESRKLRPFAPHGAVKGASADAGAFHDALYTRDGSGIFFVSDHGSEFAQLYLYDLVRAALHPLSADIPHDVEAMTLSRNGRTLAFTVNANGYSKLYLLDVRRKVVVQIALEKAIVEDLRFSSDPNRSYLLGLTLSRATGSTDAYAYDTRKGSLERWTEGEVGGINTDFFVEPSEVSYESFDTLKDGTKRRIPAFYYRPSGRGPHAVLVYLHDGPAAQYRPAFEPLVQYLVTERRIAVLAPNVRGSSGYGKSYEQLDDRDKRSGALRDVGALLQWIADQKELDAARVVLYGDSYGGFLALAALARYGERIRAAVTWSGILDLPALVQNAGAERPHLRDEFGDAHTRTEASVLKRLSPLSALNRLKSAVFVLQGGRDRLVRQADAERLVQAVRRTKRPAWYLLAREEGHVPWRRRSQEAALVRIMHFIERATR